MEIALLPQKALRIKGKQASLVVNPTDSATSYQAALYYMPGAKKSTTETIAITGPGEYEIGGIKISGIKNQMGTVYSITVDGIDIMLGDMAVVEKVQHKLKEHAIIVIQTDSESDSSFVNGLATNVVILYGDKAKEVIQKFDKEGVQEMNKYQITKDKLPPEIQTIVLA